MNAREYLMQSVKIRENLLYLRERIEKLEADLGYHPLQLDDSGASKASGDNDKVGEKLAEIADLEIEWNKKRIALEKKNDEIRATVETLQNPEYIAVLTARYLTENRRQPCRLNTWVAIAFKLGMTSEEAGKQKHQRALRALQRKISSGDTL